MIKIKDKNQHNSTREKLCQGDLISLPDRVFGPMEEETTDVIHYAKPLVHSQEQAGKYNLSEGMENG